VGEKEGGSAICFGENENVRGKIDARRGKMISGTHIKKSKQLQERGGRGGGNCRLPEAKGPGRTSGRQISRRMNGRGERGRGEGVQGGKITTEEGALGVRIRESDYPSLGRDGEGKR